MTYETTPDIDRIAFEFTSADHPIRVQLLRRLLVDPVLSLGPRIAGRLSPRAQHRALALWSKALLKALRIDVATTGLEQIDDGPYLVVALHESFVDVPVLSSLPLRLRFTARAELFGDERLGPLLRSSSHIPVPEIRSSAAMRTLLRELREATASGDSVVLFAQGSVLGVESAFESGFESLPRLLDLPILPVSIAGTHRVWGFPFDNEARFGRRVDLTVFDPISPAGWSHEVARRTEQALKRHAIGTGLARRFNPTVDGWWDDYAYRIDPDFPGLLERINEHRRSDQD